MVGMVHSTMSRDDALNGTTEDISEDKSAARDGLFL